MPEDNTTIKIPIIYAFARSGGTLLNRCLGCIPNNIVFSEVNPHASVVPLEVQAYDWFNLLSPSELPQFQQKMYLDKISRLVEVAQQQGNYLIIRDWSTLNFLDRASNDIYAASGVLEQELYLLQYGLSYCPIVLARRSADVYESLTRSFEHLQNLSVEEFGVCYLNYARTVSIYPVFHYESFCREPEKELKQICEVLCVNYSDSFITDFSKFEQCTGDNTLVKPSRGTKLDVIKPLRSNVESKAYIAASLEENCQQADNLLGYAN